LALPFKSLIADYRRKPDIKKAKRHWIIPKLPAIAKAPLEVILIDENY